jgi:hypothetical protein
VGRASALEKAFDRDCGRSIHCGQPAIFPSGEAAVTITSA